MQYSANKGFKLILHRQWKYMKKLCLPWCEHYVFRRFSFSENQYQISQGIYS